jgi:hypothetical protein
MTPTTKAPAADLIDSRGGSAVVLTERQTVQVCLFRLNSMHPGVTKLCRPSRAIPGIASAGWTIGMIC